MNESKSSPLERYEHRIVLVGSGNLASSLLPALSACGQFDITLAGRNDEHQQALAKKHNVPSIELDKVESVPAIYILAVPDSAAFGVAARLAHPTRLVVHCAGALPLPALPVGESGVLWPVQTFNANSPSTLKGVHFLVEGSTPKAEAALLELGTAISGQASRADGALRGTYHLIAVLLNNFSHHLIASCHRLAREQQVNPSILRPLIERTLSHAWRDGGELLQSGPAIRGESVIIAQEREKLAEIGPDLLPLYDAFVESIQQLKTRREAEGTYAGGGEL